MRWLEDLHNHIATQVLSIGEAVQHGIALDAIRTEIDHLSPARLPHIMEGCMWLAQAGRARWSLGVEFISWTSGLVTGRDRQIGVFVSTAT